MKHTVSEKHDIRERITSFFRKKLRSDAGDAVLTTSIIGSIFFVLISGFAIDMSKNNAIRNAHHSQAQTAAQSAVRTLDARGSLNVDTFRTFHNSLEREWETDVDTAIWSTESCSEIDGEVFPSYQVRFQAKNHAGSTDRGENTSGTFSYTAGDNFEEKLSQFIHEGGLKPDKEYRVISAEVRSSSQNIFLGRFGMPCQAYTSQVNAGAFNEYR